MIIFYPDLLKYFERRRKNARGKYLNNDFPAYFDIIRAMYENMLRKKDEKFR